MGALKTMPAREVAVDNQELFAIRAKILGVLLRNAREQAGRTLADCGTVLGISARSYKHVETGDRALSLPELELLAWYLNAPLSRFLSRKQAIEERNEALNSPIDMLETRHRIIGAQLRQAREASKLSMKQLGQMTGINPRRIRAFEIGERPAPLPELEVIAQQLDIGVETLVPAAGPVARWDRQQRAIEHVSDLTPELQAFIANPLNRPYLELAMSLSSLEGDQLRRVAESLMTITL